MNKKYMRNFAQHYDQMYHWKNYAQEAIQVKEYIAAYKKTSGNNLLEVACGTGLYIEQLHQDFQITGLDLSENMLEIARHKFPNLSFINADMRSFELPQSFDIILCLFGSIAYLHSLADLHQAFDRFYQHLKPGGIALVEPFISPDLYKENMLHMLNIDKPDIKISRQSISTQKDNIAHITMHTLVTTLKGGEYFWEEHQLALFSNEEYLQTAQKVGFDVQLLEPGLMRDRTLMLFCKT